MTRGLFSRPFEETISNAYDAVEARNRREDEARDRRDALLKGNTLEETNVYDQTHEREARKDRSAVLTSLPEPDLGGDTIEETMANVYDQIQEREARKDRTTVLTSLPERDSSKDTIEQTLSKTYDVIQARNRRDAEARDRREAPLKGNTIEETMANVYDHIQEREARKDRTAVLTNRPKRDIGGDGPRATPDQGVPNKRGVLGDWGGGSPRDRGVLWDGAKVKPSWGQIPKTPLAPTLDQVRGYPQMTELPVNQRPDVNPLTARAPRNPFGPPPFAPPVVPGWGAPITQARPVGPLGPQATYVPGLMPWSNPGPWSGAPIAPEIPRGQRFNPGAPVPSPFDPTGILRSVSGPRQGPIGWAQKVPGIFDQQRGRVTADPLRPDRRTKLAPDIEHAVLMGYMPDPRTQRDKILDRARNYRPFDRSRMVKLAHRIAADDIHPDSKLTLEARQLFHEEESNMLGYKSRNIEHKDDPEKRRVVAWGMYQFTRIAFEEVGILGSNGEWNANNKYGVSSFDDFLANPLAQEQAMEDLMIHHDDQFGNKGTYEFAEKTIDVKIDGKIVSITVTQDGLLAASHIEGAGETNKIVRSLFDDEGVFIGGVLDISVRPDDRDAEKIYNVLKRLLDFQDVPIFREG